MRYTVVQHIACIGNERGLPIKNSRWKYNAYYLRFQCEFDKYKNAGGSVPTLSQGVHNKDCDETGLVPSIDCTFAWSEVKLMVLPCSCTASYNL